jgi:uncharacterized protein
MEEGKFSSIILCYMAKLYVNLPVKDLTKSIVFYQAIGFTQNLNFTDENASSMMYGDEFSIMLLTHGFCSGYLPAGKTIADSHKTTEVLNALQLDSKNEVDILFEKAIAAGGKKTIETYDHGFMYGRDFEDLDGHIWEVFWMDVSQMPKG